MLRLLISCGALVGAGAEPTKTCIMRVGDHVMDLTPLASTQFPLEYASPDGRHLYRAALCGATSVLADSCKVTDAVAGSKSSCEFYGRASQGGKPTFVDHSDPQHGVTVTYAGGSRCASPLSPSYSATFDFLCDKSAHAPPPHKALVSVDEEPSSCRFHFVFRSPACCPVYHPAPTPDPSNTNQPLEPPSSSSLLLLLLAALCLAGYCGAGSVYKARVRGCQGFEALPHVDQLRSFARGVNEHVLRPIRRRLGLMSQEGEQRQSAGGVMLRATGRGGGVGGLLSHSATARVALAGREALLVENLEEEVAL